MKFSFLLSILLLLIFTTSAQKQTYFLFACAQQSTKDICAEKVPIKSKEIQLTTAEAENYVNNYKEELQKDYPANKKFKNIQVSLIKQGNVVIEFEGERKYTQKEDGWGCTSTFYGIVVGVDDASADKKMAALKAENKRSTYVEIKRWGKSLLVPKANNDLEVKWVKTKTNIVVFLNNSHNETALKIVIKSVKKPSGLSGKEEKDNFDKWAKVEERIIELEASGTAQITFSNADAFEIDTAPTKIKDQGSSAIDIMKHQVRKFITKPDKIEEISNMGVRG
ncbi:MAG: hypothetical protein WDM90_02990 [Ferruginibacter sp.]